jgi:hypothetical protein
LIPPKGRVKRLAESYLLRVQNRAGDGKQTNRNEETEGSIEAAF